MSSWHDGRIIEGHPTIELDTGADRPTLITVCASCGEMRTILFLSFGPRRDRWYCRTCRAEGDSRPQMYPVS